MESNIHVAGVFDACPLLNTAGPYGAVDHAGDPVAVEYPGHDIIGYFGWNTLAEVVFDDDIESIGVCAFYQTRLSGIIDLSGKLSLITIKDYAFYNQSQTVLNSITEIRLPPHLTTIGQSAFEGCRSLSTIDIPASVTHIGRCICYDCAYLQSIVVRPVAVDVESRVRLPEDAWFVRASNPAVHSIQIPQSVLDAGFADAYGEHWHYYWTQSGTPVYFDLTAIED